MCGVLQGSIWDPNFSIYMLQTYLLLHQVHVFNLLTILPCKRCKVKDIPDCAKIIQNDVKHLKA